MVGSNKYIALDRWPVRISSKWVEGRSRIRVEQGNAQGIVIDNAAEALNAMIFVEAEAGFPVPSLKIITELAQIALKTAGKQIVVRRNLVSAQACFQATITNSRGESCSGRWSANLRLRE